METIIVYIDDADYALPLLQAAAQSPNAPNTHWLLVACAPRITHRVSRFVSNRSREQWRSKWSEKLFHSCVPLLEAAGSRVTPILARSPLPELQEQLQQDYGPGTQVVDVRRPRQLVPDAQAVVEKSSSPLRPFSATLASFGAILAVCFTDFASA